MGGILKKIGFAVAFASASTVLVFSFNNCGPGFQIAQDSTTNAAFLDGSIKSPPSMSDLSEPLQSAGHRSDLLAQVNQSAHMVNKAGNCVIEGNFPVRTHYQERVGFSIKGVDGTSVENADWPQQIARGEKYVRFYKTEPEADQYHYNRIDEWGIGETEYINSLKILCSQGVSKVRFIQIDKEFQTGSDISSVIVPNEMSFQVIHSLVYKKNLFTIVIPPMWKKNNQYTTLMNGFYGLNVNLARLAGPTFFKALSDSYGKDSKGAVAILWNGQGALSSRTMNDEAYLQFNEFMSQVMPVLGLHPEKGIAFGASRGGVTALNLAAHPAVNAIKVSYVHSVVPPAEVSSIIDLVTPTIPFLAFAQDWSTGWVNSWHQDFVVPGRSMSGHERHLQVLTGSYDKGFVKQNIDLTAPAKMNKLKANKTSVFLEIGSHDNIVPFVDQYKLFQIYKKSNVSVEARVNYLVGHNGDVTLADNNILNAILKLNASQNPGALSFVQVGKKTNMKVQPQSSIFETYNLGYTDTPLTIEFPKIVTLKSKPQILATGVPGKRYAIVAKDILGNLHLHRFTLDENGVSVTEFLPSDLPVGTTRVLSVHEVDNQLQILKTLSFIASVKGNPPIEVIRLNQEEEDYVEKLGAQFSGRLQSLIVGERSVNAYSRISETNYGVLEAGARNPTEEEKLILSGLHNLNTNQTYCMASVLNKQNAYSLTDDISLNLTIPTGSVAIGQRNQIYIGAQKIATNSETVEWTSQSGIKVFKADEFQKDIGPILKSYPEVKVVYEIMKKSPQGVWSSCGISLDATWKSSKSSVRCESSGGLQSHSIRSTLDVSSSHKGLAGVYVIAAQLSNGDWYSLNTSNKQWIRYDGSEGSVQAISSQNLGTFSNQIFSNENLTAYPGARIHVGYGVGGNRNIAVKNMLDNMDRQLPLCSTLPVK